MNSTQLLIIPLTVCLCLTCCRTERKSAGNIPEKQQDRKPVSSAPPQQQDRPEPTLSTTTDLWQTSTKPSASKDREPSGEELLLRMRELERAEVFDVSVSTQATEDRATAWEKLSVADIYTEISSEQYIYAQELLDRYHEAPPLERLVVWRLVYLRLYYQHQGARRMGGLPAGGESQRKLQLSMHPKLNETLYSALGENEKLPEFLAIRKAMKMLQAASPRKSVLEY